MSSITITVVAEKDGIKAERRYVLGEKDIGRIIWAYDACFNCDGDADKIINTMARQMVMTLVDHAHSYERSQPRHPIEPKLE